MELKDTDKSYFLSLKTSDITADLIIDLFGDKSEIVDGKMKTIPSKYRTNDTFKLKKGEYFNTTDITTNCGLFIFNKLLIEEDFSKIIGYVNEPVTKKVQGGIDRELGNALMDDKITTDQYVKYLNRTQWLSMQFNSLLSGSFTMKTIKPLPSVTKAKEKLLKDNKEALDSGDVLTAVKVETELKNIARKELEGDPGMDLYNSGARGSFDNNYKAISIIKGPVYNPTTGKWDMVGSNFMEGIQKDDITSFGNAVVTGAYPKAIATAVSGYMAKQLTAGFQGIVLDEPGKDCGTKGYMTITLTNETYKNFMYRYIIEGKKLVMLDESNIKSYIGKEVKMRSPMYCIGDKLCRYCAGELYTKLGITNIGLTASRVASTLLNLNMKKFHDSTAHTAKLNKDKITL